MIWGTEITEKLNILIKLICGTEIKDDYKASVLGVWENFVAIFETKEKNQRIEAVKWKL